MTAPRKVKVFKTVSEFVPGELCFLPDELSFAKRLAGIRDPEEQQEFWRVLTEKKLSDVTYTIYRDFPREPALPPSSLAEEFSENSVELPPSGDIKKPEYRGNMAAYVGETIEYLKRIGRVAK